MSTMELATLLLTMSGMFVCGTPPIWDAANRSGTALGRAWHHLGFRMQRQYGRWRDPQMAADERLAAALAPVRPSISPASGSYGYMTFRGCGCPAGPCGRTDRLKGCTWVYPAPVLQWPRGEWTGNTLEERASRKISEERMAEVRDHG